MGGGYPARMRIPATGQTQLGMAPKGGAAGLPSHHHYKGKVVIGMSRQAMSD